MGGCSKTLIKERQEAENPNTPSSRLEALHAQVMADIYCLSSAQKQAHDLALLQTLASHPNTPLRLLAALMPSHARAFCQNPVAPFLTLEQPDFAARLCEDGQLSLLSQTNAPPALVRFLAEFAPSTEVQEAARFHVSLDAPNGSSWEDELRGYWQRYCARAEGVEREWHIDLAELGLVPLWAKGPDPIPEPLIPEAKTHGLLDGWFRYRAAPQSPKEAALLRAIGPALTDIAILGRALRRDATPADMMAVLDERGNEKGLVHAALLRHPAANAKVIARIAKIIDPRYQEMVLRNEKAPAAALRVFLKSDNPAWRRRARCHQNAPINAADISRRTALSRVRYEVKSMAGDFVYFIEALHAAEAKKTNYIAATWADVEFWQTRLHVALIAPPDQKRLRGDREKRTGHDLLVQLSHDGNRLVRAAAKMRLADPDYQFSLWDEAEEKP